MGGARSGKSAYAIKLTKEARRNVLFLATAFASDEEMSRRIRLHKRNRPAGWKTIEVQKGLPSVLKGTSEKIGLIVIDCLTLYISNLILNDRTDAQIENEMKLVLKLLKNSNSDSIVVSNEVGLGIVPDNPLARKFRDLAGRINQKVAHCADRVYFMAAGIPVGLK